MQKLPPLLPLSVIWRGKWLIAVSIALALGAAVGYLELTPPVYEAEARLLLRQKGFQFETDNGFLKDRQFLATEAEILRSEPILRRVFETVQPQLPEGYSGDPLTLVMESFTVTPSPVADVLTIDYRSNSKEDCVAVIRATIDSYQEMLHKAEGSDYVSTVDLITKREQQLREDLAVLQKRYETLRESSPLVGQGAETLNLQTQQLATLGDRLASARSRKFEVEKKLESFLSFKDKLPRGAAATKLVVLREFEGDFAKHEVDAPPTDTSEMHDVVSLSYTGFGDVALHNSAAAQMFRQQAESKLAQMHNVERQYWNAKAAKIQTSQKAMHPSHAKVEEGLKHWEELVSQQHDDWNRFLDEQVEALSIVLQQELQTARRTEQQLEELCTQTQQRAKETDSFLLREQLVQGDIERLEKVHESMLTRLVDFELADQAVAGGRVSVDVRVLEGPELNSHLIWPRPPFVLAGAMMLGCLVPVACLVTFCRPEDECEGK